MEILNIDHIGKGMWIVHNLYEHCWFSFSQMIMTVLSTLLPPSNAEYTAGFRAAVIILVETTVWNKISSLSADTYNRYSNSGWQTL